MTRSTRPATVGSLSKFDNWTDDFLADEIGALDSDIKAKDARLTSMKEEARRREISCLRGTNFVVTVSSQESRRLKTKLVEERFGKKLTDEFYEVSTSNRVTIRPIPKEIA